MEGNAGLTRTEFGNAGGLQFGREHCWIHLRWRRENGPAGLRGELYAIYLLQNAQRRGLGTLLVRELRARGFGSMAVWVLAANPFRKFYEALGGKVVDEQQIERGGQSFTESAYGWQDLNTFGDTGKRPAATSFAHD
jgi:GNAT superfamily N-acetyltransferase